MAGNFTSFPTTIQTLEAELKHINTEKVSALCFLPFFDDDIWYFLSGATSVCFIAFVVRYKYIFNIEKELCL